MLFSSLLIVHQLPNVRSWFFSYFLCNVFCFIYIFNSLYFCFILQYFLSKKTEWFKDIWHLAPKYGEIWVIKNMWRGLQSLSGEWALPYSEGYFGVLYPKYFLTGTRISARLMGLLSQRIEVTVSGHESCYCAGEGSCKCMLRID